MAVELPLAFSIPFKYAPLLYPQFVHSAENGHLVDWGAVWLGAVMHGIRQAARIHGVSKWAALKRSEREGWLKDPAAREAALQAVKHRALSSCPQPSSVTAAQAYTDEFKALGAKSRMGLARGLAGAAETVEAMPGAELVDKASLVKQVTQATSLVHGWAAQAPTCKVNLSLTSQPQTIEAEWSELNNLPSAQELP